MTLVLRSSFIPVSPERLFAFHADVANLARISPGFPPFRLESPAKETAAGDLQVIRIGWARVGVTWEARILRVVPGRLIEDEQAGGPFRSWRHQHRIAAAPGGSTITDAVSFRLLPTKAGEFIEYFLARPAIIAMFALRHRKTQLVLAHHKC